MTGGGGFLTQNRRDSVFFFATCFVVPRGGLFIVYIALLAFPLKSVFWEEHGMVGAPHGVGSPRKKNSWCTSAWAAVACVCAPIVVCVLPS